MSAPITWSWMLCDRCGKPYIKVGRVAECGLCLRGAVAALRAPTPPPFSKKKKDAPKLEPSPLMTWVSR